MASRTLRTGSSRRPSARDIAITDRDTNDRRLAQAMSYLKSEGGTDSYTEYRERVQKIHDFVVEQYLHEGYSFDPKLWRQLRAMVREAQRSFRYDDEHEGYTEEFSEDDDEDSVEGVPRLYRAPTMTEIELDAAQTEYRSSRFGSGASASFSRPQIQSEKSARSQVDLPSTEFFGSRASPALEQAIRSDILERVFKYGGPNNEPEEWLKTFPPSLPFGETLKMQKLESLMIDYDLRKSVENLKKGNNDPIVETDVKYEDVALQYVGEYDSGSKFKLPKAPRRVQNLVNGQGLNLMTVLEEFNLGGGEAAQIKRDYAPRIFLERFHAHPSYHDGESTGTSADPRRASTTASASSSSQPRRLSVSQTSTNRRPTSSDGRRNSVTSTSPSARPIARRVSGASSRPRGQDVIKAKSRRTPGPATYRLPSSPGDVTLKPAVPPRRHSEPIDSSRKSRTSVAAGSSQKTGITRRSSTGQHPTSKVPKSTLGKRKLSIVSDSFDTQIGKRQRMAPSPPTRPPKARAAKGVRFAKRITSIGSEDIVIRPGVAASKVAVAELSAIKSKSKLALAAAKKVTSKAQPSPLKSRSAVVKPVAQRQTTPKKSLSAQRKTSIEKVIKDTKEYAPSPTFARHVTRSNKKFGR